MATVQFMNHKTLDMKSALWYSPDSKICQEAGLEWDEVFDLIRENFLSIIPADIRKKCELLEKGEVLVAEL